jgi:subtilisin family serine protease
LLPLGARTDPERYVVVTVRNAGDSPGIHAASTPRGYAGPGLYRTTTTARRAARAVATDFGLTEASSWPIALLGVHCIVYQLAPGADRDDLLARLARDPRVESAQALQKFATAATPVGDPYRPLQSNLDALEVRDDVGTDAGHGVTIAVIDTGFDVAHPDLRTGGVRVRNFVDRDAAAFRRDRHGAAVAGVIAAVPNNGVGIAGIAPGANLLAYKACWQTSTAGNAAVCNSFTLAQALAAAVDAGADVINLSLAGPTDALLERLVRRALSRGAIVVGAVPPDGALDAFPAAIPGVIAVDAVEDGHSVSRAFVAPGRDVLSHAPDGHYDFFSGSSLATAEVSAIVALLRAESSALTPEGAQFALRRSLRRVSESAEVPSACGALSAIAHRDRCLLPPRHATPAAAQWPDSRHPPPSAL